MLLIINDNSDACNRQCKCQVNLLWMEDTHLDPSIKHEFPPPVHACSFGCIRCVAVMTVLCSSLQVALNLNYIVYEHVI